MDHKEVFMEKSAVRSRLLPLVIIPVFGLFVLALCYAGYFAVYMFVESVFFPSDPMSVPAGTIRNSYTALLIAVYLLLLRIKIRDLAKAIILFGPLTMLIIALILALYKTPLLAALSAVVVTACCIYLLYRYKKPWFYYYAAALSVVAAIFYAWPRN
jgi:hypothetical protein